MIAASQSSVSADPTEWTGAIDNNFSNTGNWTNGVPIPGELAEFRNEGTTEVLNFSATATFGGLRLLGTSSPVVIFELDKNTLNLDLTGTSAFLSNASSGSGPRTLTVRDGNLNMPGFQLHGLSSAWTTPVIFRLENNTAFASTSGGTRISSTGGAEMYIHGGSTWTHDGDLTFAYAGHGSWPSFGAYGLLEISGSGSAATVTAGNTVLIGRGGYGDLRVLNGGQFSAGIIHSATAGAAVNSGADILVDGENSLMTIGSTMFLAGTNISSQAAATFIARNQGVANIAEFHSWENGTTRLEGGTINVSGAAGFDNGSTLAFTLFSAGQTASLFANELNLDATTLEIVLDNALEPVLNQTFLLAEYATSLTGTFDGLAEGSTFMIDDTVFQISYVMGLGGDTIGLTVIPEPGSMAAIAGALALLLAARRRRA